MDNSPIALFMTWTVYGSFLPGDFRGWRHRQRGEELGTPALEQWHRRRLRFEVLTFDSSMRKIVDRAIRETCKSKAWTLWALSVRTNHVHVVITVLNRHPRLIRDQLKAHATRQLRAGFPQWRERPVWTAKGDIEFLDDESSLGECVAYVLDAQDRMDRRS